MKKNNKSKQSYEEIETTSLGVSELLETTMIQSSVSKNSNVQDYNQNNNEEKLKTRTSSSSNTAIQKSFHQKELIINHEESKEILMKVPSNILNDNFFNKQDEKKNSKEEQDISEKNIDFEKKDLKNKLNISLIELNLSQISLIQIGNRLRVDEEKCVLTFDTRYFKSVRRMFSGDGRENELNFIKLVIDKAIEICKTITKIQNKTSDDKRTLRSLLVNLDGAKNGLYKLKNTYIDDNLFQNQIDGITKKIDNNSTDCSVIEY